MKFVFFDNNEDVFELKKFVPREHDVVCLDIRDAITHYKPKAIISPANSYGTMGGGIDGLMTRSVFPNIVEKVQEKIRTLNILNAEGMPHFPVGSAIPVRTLHPKCTFMITTPTMDYPQNIEGTDNVYLAFSALLQLTSYYQNRSWVFLVPGMGTGVGGMTFTEMGQQIKRAFADFPTFRNNHQFLLHTPMSICIDNGEATIVNRDQSTITSDTDVVTVDE